MPPAAELCASAVSRGLRPDPLLTVSEWADRFRVLDPIASSAAGRWRTSRTPYLREVMDCLSPSSPIWRIVFMKAAQIGGTECGNNWVGYVIHQAPGPLLVVQPTVELGKRWSKQRFSPLVDATPELRALVRETTSRTRNRTSGDTVQSKEFPGGIALVTGANSAVGLRSMPIRYLFLDEVDGYPADVDGEGDPVSLAIKRTQTFARRKILMVSTPTISGQSRIEAEYEASDKRRLFVPCPECGTFQVLQWANVRWPEGKPEQAGYVCEGCERAIPNHRKTWMLERGEWRPTAAGDGRTAGFHLSGLYSPVGWLSWGEAAKEFTEASKDRRRLQVFINTVLGETWKDVGEAPDWQRLYDRRERYRVGVVPRGGVFLTAGVDVQPNRLEVEVVAWAPGRESWSVDYQVLPGDLYKPDVWSELDALLAHDWPTAWGAALPIRVLAIDSGYATQQVYAWARKHPQAFWGPAGSKAPTPRSVIVVKGEDRGVSLLQGVSAADSGPKRRGLKVWRVSVSLAKAELYGWLRQERPTEESGAPHPPGYCHFPEYGEEYFRQLTAERLVRRLVRGRAKLEWEKTRDRNEALDCRVYARAAAAAFGVDRLKPRNWEALARAAGLPDVGVGGEASATPDPAPASVPAQSPPQPQPPPGPPQTTARRRRVWRSALFR